MTIYNRGDVILVEIAFSGASGSKRRPAIIVSTNSFNKSGIKLIVAAITGNIMPPYRPNDVLLNDWSKAGLLKPSAMRCILATVDKADILQKLGTLSKADFNKIEQSLATILGFYTV